MPIPSVAASTAGQLMSVAVVPYSPTSTSHASQRQFLLRFKILSLSPASVSAKKNHINMQ